MVVLCRIGGEGNQKYRIDPKSAATMMAVTVGVIREF